MPHKDRQERLEYHRIYNATHYKSYYATNKERIRIKTRKYLANPINRAKQPKKLKAWKLANPRKVRAQYKAKDHKRRSILRDAGTHTLAEWEGLKADWNDCCAICGMQTPFTDQYYQGLTEDHIIPLSKGGSNKIENIQPLCHRCNSQKGSN